MWTLKNSLGLKNGIKIINFFINSHHRQGVDKSASGIEIFNG